MIKRKILMKTLEKEPYQLWNAFIDLLAMEDENILTDIQKNAQRAFLYDYEIQNGGHFQYFENMKLKDYSDIIKSIEFIGAMNHAIILKKSLKIKFNKKRNVIRAIKHFIKGLLEEEYSELDSEYGLIEPDMNFYLETYLKKYQDEFIEIE
jgi:hypothetical protein